MNISTLSFKIFSLCLDKSEHSINRTSEFFIYLRAEFIVLSVSSNQMEESQKLLVFE